MLRIVVALISQRDRTHVVVHPLEKFARERCDRGRRNAESPEARGGERDLANERFGLCSRGVDAATDRLQVAPRRPDVLDREHQEPRRLMLAVAAHDEPLNIGRLEHHRRWSQAWAWCSLKRANKPSRIFRLILMLSMLMSVIGPYQYA